MFSTCRGDTRSEREYEKGGKAFAEAKSSPFVGRDLANRTSLKDHGTMTPERRRLYSLPNGLEMSRPASAQIVSRIRFAAAGRVGSIELLGRLVFRAAYMPRYASLRWRT